MSNNLTFLDISYLKNEDKLQFRLFDESEISGTNPKYTQKVSEDFLEKIHREIQEIVENIKKASINYTGLQSFKRIGKRFFDGAIPEILKNKLSTISTPLIISIDDPEIIWELIYDGKDFWATKYVISRQLCEESQTCDTNSEIDEYSLRSKRRCLLIYDPKGCLTKTRIKMENLIQLFEEKERVCDCLVYQGITKNNIKRDLEKNHYEILHYSGHIEWDDKKNESYFELSDGKKFYASCIQDIDVRGIKLVFLNGCYSAKGLKSFADVFLKGGAKVVIGTIFEIPEEGALRMADIFYSNILNGTSVGESLQKTRLKAKEENLGTTWASYILYGDPRCHFTDPIPIDVINFLKKFKFGVKNFDFSCLQVIAEAIKYAQTESKTKEFTLNSCHLFAAMATGDNCVFKIKKEERSEYRDEVERIFKSSNRIPIIGWRFTKSISEIFISLKFQNNGKITEDDLLRSFIESGGGMFGKELGKSGIRLKELVDPPPTLHPDVYTSSPGREKLTRSKIVQIIRKYEKKTSRYTLKKFIKQLLKKS